MAAHGRPQTVTNATLAKAITTSDEFKNGFPSEGLSTVSNKWWGSGSPDGYDGASAEKGGGEIYEEKNVGPKPQPQGTDLLTDVRKRAGEEGRERLKLGVVKGFRGKKLGNRDKALLLRIFKSSLRQHWIYSQDIN